MSINDIIRQQRFFTSLGHVDEEWLKVQFATMMIHIQCSCASWTAMTLGMWWKNSIEVSGHVVDTHFPCKINIGVEFSKMYKNLGTFYVEST